eukprot:CAMPEP_0114694012 /NCGR_PEP_ID=MMETSP0191-20121206/69705_1 /TAXON_ID=126664 /ORGANISM="Sorites sp." /LENGTH=244 /DNA_ID=CAMNT_0001988375 /DNA_START=160 /DNA_END=894 /DNA_ORIENTATION=-
MHVRSACEDPPVNGASLVVTTASLPVTSKVPVKPAPVAASAMAVLVSATDTAAMAARVSSAVCSSGMVTVKMASSCTCSRRIGVSLRETWNSSVTRDLSTPITLAKPSTIASFTAVFSVMVVGSSTVRVKVTSTTGMGAAVVTSPATVVVLVSAFVSAFVPVMVMLLVVLVVVDTVMVMLVVIVMLVVAVDVFVVVCVTMVSVLVEVIVVAVEVVLVGQFLVQATLPVSNAITTLPVAEMLMLS